jgi:hypothetical protein
MRYRFLRNWLDGPNNSCKFEPALGHTDMSIEDERGYCETSKSYDPSCREMGGAKMVEDCPPTVGLQLEQLALIVAELTEVVDGLEKRLLPITRPVPPEAQGECKANSATQREGIPEYVGVIIRLSEAVNNLRYRVYDQTARLSL